VRVATVTHTRDHLVDEMLTRTNVEVERIPVDRVVEAIPPVKDDAGVTIIPIVEETVIVERKLVLKEELHIRRKQTTERFQQTVPLRYQTAQVTRIPASQAAADDETAAGSITKRNPEDT
jgi:stress response protein YsnF